VGGDLRARWGISVEKRRGLWRRATSTAEVPIIHPRMLRGACPEVLGKTTCRPACVSREPLLHGGPPAGTANLWHRRCEVARSGAVHQRQAEARGRDVVLQVGIKSHGPPPLESLWARVEPIRLAKGGTAGACRQGQCWQQQKTVHVHRDPPGLRAVGRRECRDRTAGTPRSVFGRFCRQTARLRPWTQTLPCYGS
jgi:hypothetical protein